MNSQLTLAVQRQHHLEAARMYRAVEIVNKQEIKRLPSGNFQVVSQSEPGKVYMVNPRYEECNCVDCRVNGNVCKHYIAYLLLVAQQPVRRPTFACPFCNEVFTVQLDADYHALYLCTKRPVRKTYDDYLRPRQDVIAERNATVKANKPQRTEWVEELDLA